MGPHTGDGQDRQVGVHGLGDGGQKRRRNGGAPGGSPHDPRRQGLSRDGPSLGEGEQQQKTVAMVPAASVVMALDTFGGGWMVCVEGPWRG